MIHVASSQSDRDSVSVTTDKSVRRFRPLLLHAGSIWRKYVVDVEGNVVRCGLGLPVNVYRADFADILRDRRIRFVYDVAREFRFVTSSDDQYESFVVDVVHGTTTQNKSYHVYYDDDVAALQLLRLRGLKDRARVGH
jgi:hypothetical protein